jgi:hypothetical protein
MIPMIDRENEMVLGHVEMTDFGLSSHLPNDQEKLDAALDFESTGRRQTAAKALLLMARGSHVSGFVLRSDDGLSDAAIVCNGATRFLSPQEMEWLMHGPRVSIMVGDEERLARLEKIAEAALAVVERWDLPVWKDAAPTGDAINRLRNALGVEE